jgi:hypothetical protein
MADIDAVKDVMVPLLERMLGGFDQVHVVDVLLVLVGPAGGFLSYEFVEANADKAGKVHIFHIDPFSRVVSLSQPPAVRSAARQLLNRHSCSPAATPIMPSVTLTRRSVV